SKKGVMPMMIKDMIRLNSSDVQLWNGERWVNVIGWGKSNDTSQKLEIVLRSGERIQCTGGHKWVLSDGTEKLASELSVGDKLATTEFEDESSHTPSMLTKDILWLMGLFIAEGSFSDDCIQLALNSDEFEWVERIKIAVESVGGTITYTLKDNNLSVRIYSQVFFAILHQYVGGHSAKNKHLNNICWQMPNSNLQEIMNGYLDGDANYDSENNRWRIGFTRNYDWERDLRLLANRLGAVLTLNLSNSYIGDKKYPSFRGEWRWNGSDHFNCKDRAEIVEINKGRGRNFYDISVDCDNHLFSLASGVLTHNCKPNPMPESVKDRCTKSHEYIFLLSKSPRYYFDQDAIMEDAISDPKRYEYPMMNGVKEQNDGKRPDGGTNTGGMKEWTGKRNKRDVWSVRPSTFKGAHFATFPTELVEPMLFAGCPEGGTVLDPFMGSGTVGVVAKENNRNYVGCELNDEYADIAEKRLSCTMKSLF
ncbi:MAG: hypothetical protein J6Y78_16495, partial [Paludibacteraceae bacterium]|nr:hypothetical protein [Paludibacteraceae bacterium]